jgi:Flp pilus assembly pilin Flp
VASDCESLRLSVSHEGGRPSIHQQERRQATSQLWLLQVRFSSTRTTHSELIGGSSDLANVTRRGSVMKQALVGFVRHDEGQDLIEYALLGGIITAALASTVFALRDRVQALIDALRTNIGG